LHGQPAHEWIGVTLAKAGSRRPKDAVDALLAHAPAAVQGVAHHLRGLTFFIAGWDWFGNPPTLRPHFAIISNTTDNQGKPLAVPSDVFAVHLRLLRTEEDFAGHSVGQPLPPERATALTRNLRRLIEHSIGPKDALRYLVDEIQCTSQAASTVGDRILAMCIPFAAVQKMLNTGHSRMLASQPRADAATFSYFDPTMNEFGQFGPTFVNGSVAVTDVETESRPEDDFQSSSVRFLYRPPSKSST
jgi:hypothetical protein